MGINKDIVDNFDFVVETVCLVDIIMSDLRAAFAVRENRKVLYGFDDKQGGANVGCKFRGFPEWLLQLWANNEDIIVYENEEQLKQFIEDARTIRNFQKTMYLGVISGELAERIKTDIKLDDPNKDVDLKNYNCVLPADTIRHAFCGHGNEEYEKMQGQRAITVEDILMIPRIIQEYDSINLSPKSYRACPVLSFKKILNGRATVIAHLSGRRMNVTVNSMWSGKNKIRSTPTRADVKSPAITSETGREQASTTINNINNITDFTEKINQKNSFT